MGERRRVGFLGNTHYILWFTNSDRGFSAIFCPFFDRNTTDLVKKILHFLACRRKKKQKTQISVFFLVGHIFSPSEESWTKEYSECCLTSKYPYYKFFNMTDTTSMQSIWFAVFEIFEKWNLWDGKCRLTLRLMILLRGLFRVFLYSIHVYFVTAS